MKTLCKSSAIALALITIHFSLFAFRLHARDVVVSDGTNGVRIVSAPSFARPTGGARCVRVAPGYGCASVFGSVPLVVEEWQRLSQPNLAAARRRYAKATVAEYGPGLYPPPAASPMPFGTSRSFGGETYVPLPHPAGLPSNAVIAVTADVDGNGEYTPGEPYGVCMVPDGDYSRATVWLTKTHPSIFRINLAEAVRANTFDAQKTLIDRGVTLYGNGADKASKLADIGTNMPPATVTDVPVHIIRSEVNGISARKINSGGTNSVTYYAGVYVATLSKNLAEDKLLTEADLLGAGLVELDVRGNGAAHTDYLANLGISAGTDTNYTYRVVIGKRGSSIATNSNNLATCFVNTFEAERTATQAVAPQGTIHAPPTFTWRHDNSIGKDYPVFLLQIMEADGNLLASTGYLRAPARAADGTFSWRWPVDMSIRTNGVMLCGVRYELGGSVITTDRYLLGNKSYKWKVTMMDSKFTTVDDTNPATDFFNAFTNLYPTAETTP